jgi:hypothetical protein
MINVVVLQGAAVPGTDSVFYLQIQGETFSGAHDVEIHMSGGVAAYVKTALRAGLLCVVKGRYVPSGGCVEAESVSLLRDQLSMGDPLWQ